MNASRRIAVTLFVALMAAGSAACQGGALLEPRTVTLSVALPGGGTAVPSHGLLADLDQDGDADLVGWGLTGLIGVVKANNGVFLPGVGYPISQNVVACEVRDLDGDGDRDIVALGASPGASIWVFLNDGTGAFGATPVGYPLAAGNAYVHVQTGRLVGGDQIPDVIVQASSGASEILQGLGGGTFAAGLPGPAVGTTMVSIADDDVDGDDDLHAVVATTLVTLRNNGGTFSPIPQFTAPSADTLIPQCKDLNTDGILDLAIYGSVSIFPPYSFVQIAFGTGGGLYAAASVQAAPSVSQDPQIVDLDGDGDLDVLASHVSGLVASRNVGLGVFAPPVALDLFSSGTSSFAVGDVTGDGIQDILTFHPATPPFAKLRSGIPASSGWPSTLSPFTAAGVSPTTLEVDDLNLDGKPDAIFFNYTVLYMLLDVANAPPTVGIPIPQVAFSNANDVLIRDFNRDGVPDVCIAGVSASYVFLGSGTGALGPGSLLPDPGISSGLEVADVNGDLIQDFVYFASPGTQLVTYFGDGTGGASAPPVVTPVFPYPAQPVSHFLADVNLDGFVDAVVVIWSGAATNQTSFSTYLGSGSGSFVHAADHVIGSLNLQGAAMGDVNGDGMPDLVVTGKLPPTFMTWTNAGNGSFTGPTMAPVVGPATFPLAGAPVLGDVSGDGFLDVVTDTGLVMVNDGMGGFAQRDIVGAPNASSKVRLADFNHDLQLDALFSLGTNGVTDVLCVRNVASCSGTGYAYGLGCPGGGGFVPTLSARGCAAPGGTLTVDVRKGLGAASAFLFVDTATASVPVGLGCTALVSFMNPVVLPLLLSGPPVGGTGTASLAVAIPASFPPGVSVALQAAIVDPGSAFGMSASNGFALTIQ